MPLDYSRVTLAGPLWTVVEAKALQLRLRDADHDADVQEKLDTAQEVILGYLGAAADATWTPTTAPKGVKHAVLLLTAHLYAYRGDDGLDKATDAEIIWRQIQQLLAMYRDPTLG
jgi:hypothetical protein